MIIIAERAFKISDSGPELKFLKIWGMSQNWAIKRLPYYNMPAAPELSIEIFKK